MKVFELTNLIKTRLETDFSSLKVEGEISNYRPSSSGHVYFTLKDEKSVISAVIFKNQASMLDFSPKDGQYVEVIGRLSVYAPRGNYQIICSHIHPAGEGNLLQLLEERKQRLAAEGLFDPDRKKKIPLNPHKILLITSPTGAALRDILQVLERRNGTAHIVILPCPVQGEGAAEKIAAQIERANHYSMGDVIIAARGGGSIEDLLPFSEECVVRAAFQSDIPIISGVGHEIDFSLLDFVADYRAPTPSAAAELVSAHGQELINRVVFFKHILISEMSSRLEKIRLLIKPFSFEELEENFYRYLEPVMMKLDDEKETILFNMKERIDENKYKVELLKRDLNNSSPLAVLERGFARITNQKGETVMNSALLTLDEDLNIRLHKGTITGTVKEIIE
jgi:exodeoxyribonuclease VII large subunit